MKDFYRLLSIIFLVLSTNFAYGSQCQESGIWNWYADDFKDFDGRSMDKPWYSDAHVGVSMTNNSMCYEDGWRLMTRKFKCIDFYSEEQCKGAISRPGSYKPKFALYNIHTGVVRFFLYVDSANINTQRVQLSFSMDQGSSSHDYGLFLNDNDEVTVYNDKTTETNKGKVMIFPGYGLNNSAPKWLIFDKYLSYEPNKYPDNGLQFNIYFEGIEESAINMEGNFEFKIEEIQSTTEKSIVETLVDSADDVMKSYSSVSELSSDLKDKGNSMINKELKDAGYDPNDGPPNLTTKRYTLGKDLVNLGVSIASVSGPIGYVAAAATLVNAFDNSPSSPKISYGAGSINLKGSIFTQYGINHRTIGVPYSNHYEDANESELEEDGYNEALGLFHFNAKPRMAFYNKKIDPNNSYKGSALVGRLLDDVRPLVTVNPNTGMILEDIKVLPYLELKDFPLYGDFPITMVHGKYGMKEEETALYTDSLQIDLIQKNQALMNEMYFDSTAIWESPNYDADGSEATIGNLQVKSPELYNKIIGSNFLNASDAMYLTIRASGEGRFLSNPWTYHIQDAKLKVYLKFKHPSKPNVYAEFVKILDVKEFTCDSISASTLLSSHGTLSMNTCRGLTDTDGDGINDITEVGFAFNPFDPSDMGLDSDNDGVSNKNEILNRTNPHN